MAIRLTSPTARAKLAVRKKPFFIVLGRGIALGYRRNAGAGTWIVRCADGKGSNWTKAFASADDHEKADGEHVLSFEQAAERTRALARGQNTDAATGADSVRPGSVSEAIADYEADLRVRGGNVVNAQRLRRLLPPALLTKPVALLTTKELRRFRDALAERMKRSSVNRACKPLAAALNLAAKHDKRIANRDAWRDGLEAFRDTHNPDNVVLSDAEVRRLVRAAYASDPVLGLLVEVLAMTGARISQVKRLVVGDVLAANGHSALNMPSAKKGKGEKKISRVPVPIPATLAARLRKASAGRGRDQALLLRADGKPWEVAGADHRLAFMAAVEQAGLDPARVTTYALRHTSITRHLLRGVPIRVVAALHDTSVPMIEKTYSASIAGHGDELARAALLDLDPPRGRKVIPLGERRP
jgi:integrase